MDINIKKPITILNIEILLEKKTSKNKLKTKTLSCTIKLKKRVRIKIRNKKTFKAYQNQLKHSKIEL